MADQLLNQLKLPNKILIVDDDPSVAQAIIEPLGRHAVKTDKASTLDTALYLFNTNRYDVVLLEIEFEPMPGLALVQKWRQHDIVDKRSTAFIMLAGNKNVENFQGTLRELGHLELLIKPFSMPQLITHLSRALITQGRLKAVLEAQTKVMSYFEKTGDLAKAADYIKSRLHEMGPAGYNMLYDLYEKGGNYTEAMGVVDGLLAKDPKNIALLNTKGRLLMKLGNFAEAKMYMERADAVAPHNIQRLTDLSDAFLNLKDPDGAVKTFDKLLPLKADEPGAKFEMFDKLYNFGFDEHAIKFGKEHAQPVEIVRHYNNKGVLLSKDGNTEKALTEYQRALRFYPKFRENYRILYNVALANIGLKTRDSLRIAQQSLVKCIELAPDFEKAKTLLKTVEESLNKSKKAG